MPKTLFVCSQCGNESPKWHGRCPGCGEWNTMVEERLPEPVPGGVGGGLSRRSAKAAKPVQLADVEAPALGRFETGIGELDRVLGGGIVPGSLVLIGGAPGGGKSTLAGCAGAGRGSAAGGERGRPEPPRARAGGAGEARRAAARVERRVRLGGGRR